MSNQAVDVKILGKITRVNCPAGQEESLIQAAQELNDRLQMMSEKTKVTNEINLLTIAALNICYELQEKNQASHHLSERIEKLSASLEDALRRSSQPEQG